MTTCSSALPVNCATGTFWHTFTDASIPGLGIPLNLTRTYSSDGAATNSPLGYGWTNSYDMQLSFDGANVTVAQENGSTVTFYGVSGTYFPGAGVLASLVKNDNGTYTFTRDSTKTRYLFNGAGRLIEEIDRNGHATTLTYNGSSITEVTDQAARSLTFAYSSGHLVSMSDPMGHTTTYTYDAGGNLASTVDPLGRTWSFTYGPDHRLLTMTDPMGGITANTYDSSGRVTAQVDPVGRTTTWSYTGEPETAIGGTTTITDPRGVQTEQHYANLELTSVTAGVGTPQAATTSYEYDMATLGPTKITDPNGGMTTQTYDSRGDLLSTTDPLAHVATYTYDPDGDLLKSTDPLGITTTYTYDENGNLLSRSIPLSGGGTSTWSFTYGTGATAGDRLTAKDPNGNTTTYSYDVAGDVTSVTDPLGHQATASYDEDGRRLSRTTPKGQTTTYVYDVVGELISETGPLGEATTCGYDANGNRVSTTDANGHTTKRAFNADNELIQVTRPDGGTLTTERDAGGNTVAQIDGAGHATTYAYDPLGRVVSTTDPNGHSTSYRYDAAGHETAMVDAAGETTEYAYDAAGALTGIDYSDAATPDVSEAYDADGRRTKLADGSGTSEFTYDSLGRMTSSEEGAGAVVHYGYDPAGQLTTLTYPNGKSVTRDYDAAGNLTSVTDWQGHTTNFSYDADGNLSQEQRPGNVITQLGYDDADRLTAITDTQAASTLARFDYTRDPVGRVTSETANNGEEAGTTNYSYDALGQLTAAGATSYGYDAADNPTIFGAVAQAFDAANELSTSSGPGAVTGPPSEGPPSAREASPATTANRPATVDAIVSAKSGRQKTLTTPALRTHGSADLIVAFISAAHGQSARAISGDHLRWSRLARADGPGGATEIWQAHATARLSGPISIRLRHGGQPTTATITAFTGQSAYIAAYAASHGQASAPAGGLTAPKGTALWGVGHSVGQTHPIAPRAGQRLVAQAFDKRAHTDGWVQQATTSSAVRIADKGSSAHWTLLSAAIATRAAQSAGPAEGAAGNSALSVPSGPGLLTRQFTYDARGNRTEEATPGAAPRHLTYDQQGRLVAVDSNIIYRYNGDGLRASKAVGATTTPFVWNQAESIPGLLQSGSTSYLYGPGGMPIEQITEETPTFLLQDQQGSTRVLTDAGGAVVGRYSYSPWGKVTSHTGTATTSLQFDGQYADGESGLIYLRARYYDPATAVFISRDPLAALTGSPYGYTANDPGNATDATGMWSLKIWAEKKALDNYSDWLLDQWIPRVAQMGPGPELFAGAAHGITAYGDILGGLEEYAAGAMSSVVASSLEGWAGLATVLGAPPWVSNGLNDLASLASWAGPQLRQLGYENLRSGISEAGEAGGQIVEGFWYLVNHENPNLAPPPGDSGGVCRIPANWPPRPGV